MQISNTLICSSYSMVSNVVADSGALCSQIDRFRDVPIAHGVFTVSAFDSPRN